MLAYLQLLKLIALCFSLAIVEGSGEQTSKLKATNTNTNTSPFASKSRQKIASKSK